MKMMRKRHLILSKIDSRRNKSLEMVLKAIVSQLNSSSNNGKVLNIKQNKKPRRRLMDKFISRHKLT